MSYRSFKRALGETNIERKCRILFGLCLGILVCGAFFWVERITEDLVERTNEVTARDFAANALLTMHWKFLAPDQSDYADQMKDDLLSGSYDFTVLLLDDDLVSKMDSNEYPEGPRERELLENLRDKWSAQLAEQEQVTSAEQEAASELLEAENSRPELLSRDDWVFAKQRLPEKNKYYFYQPVYWKKNCMDVCHTKHEKQDATFSLADISLEVATTQPPFRVVRVELPYTTTQMAITKTRAVLIATAILMIFFAMVALYLIVRYVIVKPLKHLTEVSEEVSQGNSQLRADIQTNDEFENLADSFNRMLQHLTDAQGKLKNVNTDLDAKVDELAQLNMRLYEMNRLKSDFLANMSHELRTPLNSIIGFSEVLQGIDSLTDKQKRYAHNIQKSGRVLLEMINDILDLAKLEAGKMELRPSEFRIDIVINAQCDMVRPLCEEKNIDLDVRLIEDQPAVYQDQSKIQQILTNLLSNAIKFTPEGGRIKVTSERTAAGLLRLSVADTGVGIPEEDREIIFEKFRQSEAVLTNDGLTREFAGTGLGLSIVKELCKLLGGEISFESELGKGSTFSATIPWTLREGPSLGRQVSQQLDAMSRTNKADFESTSPTVPVTSVDS